MKSDLAGLSLNQEASQKKLEGVRKMVQRQTLPRRSSSSESTAKNKSTSPGSTVKKAKNKRTSIYNCSLFIEVFRELSKHTPYFYGIYFYSGTYFHRAQKIKLLTGLTSVLEENYKYAPEQNVAVQIFCYNHYHLNHYYTNIINI